MRVITNLLVPDVFVTVNVLAAHTLCPTVSVTINNDINDLNFFIPNVVSPFIHILHNDKNPNTDSLKNHSV